MAAPVKKFDFTYDDMMKILEKPNKNNLYQDCDRGRFNPEDLESILLYLARNATPAVKIRIFTAMTERGLNNPDEVAHPPRKSRKKTSRSEHSTLIPLPRP